MKRSAPLVLPLVLWALAANAAPSAGLSLSHDNQLGELFRFSAASIVVDGRPYAARDQLGPSAQPLIEGTLDPGTHVVTVEIAYVGRSGLFSYINSYRFRFRARLLVQLSPGDLLRISTTAHLRSVTHRWEDRPELRLQAVPEHSVLEKAVLPVIRDPMLPDGGFPAAEPLVSASDQANADREADQAIADVEKEAGTGSQNTVVPASAKLPLPASGPGRCRLPTPHFSFARADVRRRDARALAAAAACLANGTAPIRIAGFCDPIGDDDFNRALGARRARAVERYLIAHGLDESRLSVVSYGRSQLVCRGMSARCRARDRRVELRSP